MAEVEFTNEDEGTKQGLRRHHEPKFADHRSYHLHHHSGVVARQRGSVATARNARWENETDPRHAASLKWNAVPQDKEKQEKKQPLPQPRPQPKSPIRTEESSPDVELGMHSLTRASSSRGSRRLSVRANPFSARSGKKLTWTNVNMELASGNGKGCGCSKKNISQTDDAKFILKQCWGEVPDKEVTAIIGPSGSGKVSFATVIFEPALVFSMNLTFLSILQCTFIRRGLCERRPLF